MTVRHVPLWLRLRMAIGPAERWALSTWGAVLVFMAGLPIIRAVVPHERQGSGLLGLSAIAVLWWWLWSNDWKSRP
jgi:hypothetical protein